MDSLKGRVLHDGSIFRARGPVLAAIMRAHALVGSGTSRWGFEPRANHPRRAGRRIEATSPRNNKSESLKACRVKIFPRQPGTWKLGLFAPEASPRDRPLHCGSSKACDVGGGSLARARWGVMN